MGFTFRKSDVQETVADRVSAVSMVSMRFMFIVVLRLEGDVGSDGEDACRGVNAAIDAQRSSAGGNFGIEALVRRQGPEILGPDPEAQSFNMDFAKQHRRE